MRLQDLALLLKCPPTYLKISPSSSTSSSAEEILVLAHRDWLSELVKNQTIPEVFQTIQDYSEAEIEGFLSESRVPSPDWSLLTLKIIPVNFKPKIIYNNNQSTDPYSDNLTLPEIVQRINQKNFRDVWRSSGKTSPEDSSPASWEEQLLDLLQRMYGKDLAVIRPENEEDIRVQYKTGGEAECKPTNLVPLHCLILTKNVAILIQTFQPTSVLDLLKFSPAIISDTSSKYLFILYQILEVYKTLSSHGICFGDQVNLGHFKINDTLHIQYEPPLLLEEITVRDADINQNIETEHTNTSDKLAGLDLREATARWCSRQISNLEYLLILNREAGRIPGHPNNHPVVPWVCDFTSKDGGLRDLTRSKFRLNKGDLALDLTYESGQHHVTEVLSEITYYTYKSRVTHKSILCKYVRPSWVPEEYPSSIQRLMAWSPDEAIPEFFTDPAIFRSIHPDLSNLTLPDWVEDAEEFCTWHLSRLESEEVSRHLHSWIDLTFGYKLSGPAAVRNKNVCLSLADSHKDLRSHGVLQLFTHPHPVRGELIKNRIPSQLSAATEPYILEDIDDEIVVSVNSNEDMKNTEGKIILPNDYNPLEELLQLETLQVFRTKSGNIPADIIKQSRSLQDKTSENASQDLRVIGCLLVELYLLSRKRMFLLHNSFSKRCEAAATDCKLLPSSVRDFAGLLLRSSPSEPVPPELSPDLITSPLVSVVAFPECFPIISQILSLLSEFQEEVEDVGELCVTIIARTLMPVLPSLSEECLELLLPFMSNLLSSPQTAVISAWLLFDPITSSLGISKSRAAFLDKTCQLYMNGTTTAKHAKLYHRSFLQTLISRFRLKVFLEKFINPLIEAVGGYKDLEWDSERQGLAETIILDRKDEIVAGPDKSQSSTISMSDQVAAGVTDSFSEGEVFAFDSLEENNGSGQSQQGNNPAVESRSSQESLTAVIDLDTFTRVTDNAEDKHDETNISTVASESVIWLSQRLGPLLACRYLARNLLRMLALCYSGPEGVRDTGRPHHDQRIRVSSSRLSGDLEAAPVLDCLCQLAGLYGDSLVVVQYLPHCWDLVSRAKRRISPSLESCLLASAAVTHSSVSLLSDSVLMNELPHSLLAHILAPLLQVTTSRRVVFLSGPRARLVLLYKLLDAIYIVGLRIGEEMSRLHLTPLATGLLSAFDKLEDLPTPGEGDDDSAGLSQLQQVLTPSATYSAYVCFHQLLGGSYLESKLSNPSLIKRLILNQQSLLGRPVHRPASFLELQGLPPAGVSYCGSGTSGTGNMIVVSQEAGSGEALETGNDLNLISKPPVNSGRHLRGNWLAYWEHELGKDERNSAFNFKQIKLQTFSGHVGSVRSLAVLDNENSFLSGGKDKTVRLWSVRNVGEGDLQVGSQSVFTQHRKSVFYVSHLPSSGHCATCDGSLLVWDPFVMTTVREFEPSSKSSFCAAKKISEPGHSLAVATSEATVRLVDTRAAAGQVAELKVSQGAAGLIRSLGVSGDGHQLAVGHTSGYISMLDIRTGKLKTGFKAHDGEVLTLTNINKQFFVSTSLDQLASGWRWEDGRQAASLRAFPEPLHCVCAYDESEVIMGSTANRIIIQQSVETDSPSSAHKLKGDLMKGNLTQMSVLPLNKQLLMGTDSGNIHLVC